ncbi:MAG: hypothetical protein H6Q90_5710 [Deltaproteobacteria bacterium]|nr:hypothetical protein [Deltaproteobacteria bacterium]
MKHDDPTPLPMPDPGPQDATPAPDARSRLWPELEGYPRTAPERVVALPARSDALRFEVGGPVIAGDVAVVSSSQFGFVAVDWRRGTIAWTKPAGAHVAPPLARPGTTAGDGSVVLIGECVNSPGIPSDELLLGCVRVVTNTGTDQAYIAIRGKRKAVAAFVAATGPQTVWPDGDRAVRWRRGDVALTIDLVSGAARPADAAPPPLAVTYKDRHWDVSHVDGRIIARTKGRAAWSTQHPYTALLGSVWLPDQSPMLRILNLGAFRDAPEVHLLDIDATGSLHAQAARPTPGIGLLGWGVSPIGDAAIAVRMDVSLQHDFVVGYAANAVLMWVYPLPEVPRADPVGVAVAPDAVVVFHDGDTLTILPELSAPPTTPGAARAPSQIPTP